jgi:hypothetical protein
MAVATITLESTNGDSVVVSAPNDAYLDDDIILDTNPEGMYDTGFTLRTQSGAFETGGRAIGIEVPIREPRLPFHLTKASRPRFQRLWGSPYNLQKVKCTWDGPSGPRSLILKLAKEIAYTTEDGFDVKDDDDDFYGVVSAVAVNPMYEGVEDKAEWTNPGDRFTVMVQATGGTFPLAFGGSTASIAWNTTAAAMRSALEALPSVGAGHVTVTGTPATSAAAGNYVVQFSGVTGTLTGSGTINTLAIGGIWGVLGWDHGRVTVAGECIGWFEVWNPTDQPLSLEWAFDPALSWQFPDHSFGQERKWNRPAGADLDRMIVSEELTQRLSVMSDPIMDTYVNADLSNAAGQFGGVEPLYQVPPYTGVTSQRVVDVNGAAHIIREVEPVLMPVICNGPAGAKATLRQRRFWSAESGLE